MQKSNKPRRTVKHPRIAAEWEPTLGVIVSYPLNVPHTLIIAMAKHHHLFVMAPSEKAKAKATREFIAWQIDLANVSFVVAPHGTDMSWTRDWGPHAMFDAQDKMKLVDPLYLHRTPYSSISGKDPLWRSRIRKWFWQTFGPDKNPDNEMPKILGQHFQQEVLSLPFALTGGNVYFDGHGNAMSMEVLLNENERLNDVSDDVFFDYCEEHLGIDRYAILPNFEDHGIQHIDCYLKQLDEERLLVLRPPQDHPYHQRYQEIIESELKSLRTPYGRRYQILRLDTARFRGDELAAYVNGIILNQHIYIPLYNIPQDEIALAQWRAAMPGYTVQGFEYDLEKETAHIKKYQGIGWRSGDALHCRTRGVWDPQMLYLSVNRIPSPAERQETVTIEALVKDYSQMGVQEGSVQTMWRVRGESDWHSLPMHKLADTDTYQAQLDVPATVTEIDYYVTASSHSGRKETMPRTAPQGFYQVQIQAL